MEMCSTPSPAFDWSKTPGLSDYTGSIQNIDKVFLANFILYWIALGITLVALVITVMSHFRRGPDLIASLGTFLAFGVMLVVFVIVLVISMKGINGVKDGHSDSHGYLGASTWCTLGGFIALLFSSINYCIACIFGPGRGAVAGKV